MAFLDVSGNSKTVSHFPHRGNFLGQYEIFGKMHTCLDTQAFMYRGPYVGNTGEFLKSSSFVMGNTDDGAFLPRNGQKIIFKIPNF